MMCCGLIHWRRARKGVLQTTGLRNTVRECADRRAALIASLLATVSLCSTLRGQSLACCTTSGSCTDSDHNACVTLPGEPYPPGTDCATTVCTSTALVQAPVFGNPPTGGCLEAWGELSAFAGIQTAADDFTLAETAAITEIHWWGTYQNWLDVTPPQPAPDQFQIAVWSHVAALTGSPPTSFDRPGTALKLLVVDRSALSETYVGCSLDTLLQNPFGATFRYSWSIPSGDQFVATGGTTYWLSIAAVYGNTACACDADVTAPFGTYDTADVDFVVAQIGCPVGMGDTNCDAADVNCDSVVDGADQTMANCQRVSAFADPACCFVAPVTAWGWAVRPLSSNAGAVRIQSPTMATDGSSFGVGESLTDTTATAWDASFALVTTPTSLVAPDAPLADLSGVDRNRYLGFRVPVPWSGASVGIRVRLVSLDRFSSFDGALRWAGIPGTFPDDTNAGTTFAASGLRCDPVFSVWPQNEPAFVYGPDVVPGSTYELQAVDMSCQGDLGNEACYSSPLVVSTNKWGDIVVPIGGASQPNFADISAVVDKFQGVAGAVSKTRAQVQPDTPDPNTAINFQDISAVVRAFQLAPYPFSGPQTCP